MNKKNFKKAYSLLELSIVILIISILITGALSVSVGSINNAKIKTTQDRQREVYKAIGNFLITNRRLPCPASLKKIKTVDTDYGSEVGAGNNCDGDGVYRSSSNGNSNLVYGMVPARALGLSNEMAEDAFESKLVYIVDKNFTNPIETVPNFSNQTFATANSVGVITVNEKPSGITQTDTADAIVILISYGANKFGSFNSNSSSQNSRSTDADELENDATAFDNPTPKVAAFNNVIIASSTNSDIFDDLVFFKRRNDFVEDFRAMFMIPCNGSVATTNFSSSLSAYYGQIVYNTACASPAIQTRKCEAYGAWINITNSCM